MGILSEIDMMNRDAEDDAFEVCRPRGADGHAADGTL